MKTLTAFAATTHSQPPLERAADRARPALSPHEIARLATRALWNELALSPKPGLVSLRDAGSHSDMDASTFVRSLFALRGHFRAFAAAGARAAPFAELRAVGLRAEAAMLSATGGVNTHRGAIFAIGLLGAATASASMRGENLTDNSLRSRLTNVWGAALEKHMPGRSPVSHGVRVAERYGASGARGEARGGFFRAARKR